VTLFNIAIAVFKDDDGIINYNSQNHNKTEEGVAVKRSSGKFHKGEGEHEGYGNTDGDHEGIAPAEKQI